MRHGVENARMLEDEEGSSRKPHLLGLSNKFLPGEGTIVAVDKAEEDEALTGDSRGSAESSSSSSSSSLSSSLSSTTGTGSSGDWARRVFAKER